MSGPSKQHRIEQFERLCRERGLPMTTQRRTVFEMILEREDHPTADQIYDQVRRQIHTISRTSVYRILETLVELGLITRICHPGSAARFDPKTQRHDHLICLRCEEIIDLEEKKRSEVVWPDVRRYGFEIRDHHIHFRGLCAACREKRSAEEKRRPRTGSPRPGTPAQADSRRTARKRRIPS